MKQYNLCFLGFGNVGRALARLLVAKASELRELYSLEYRVTGISSRRIGWLTKPEGFDVSTFPLNTFAESKTTANGISEWLREARPDAVFETTSLNPDSGQPAINYLGAVLESGAHAITANKGVLVYGYRELADLARA